MGEGDVFNWPHAFQNIGQMKAEEKFQAWLIRQDKEKSRALETRYYGDPSKAARFTKKEAGELDRLSDREIADSLLMEWYRWAKEWRPKLGAPRVSPYCRQSVSSRQYDEDAAYDKVWQKQMEAVDYCVDAIAVSMQQAIGTEMRNRASKAKVWRDPGNKSYLEALLAILPVMRKRGLFD